MFAANAGTILGEQRSNLEAFLKRGGGIVVITIRWPSRPEDQLERPTQAASTERP